MGARLSVSRAVEPVPNSARARPADGESRRDWYNGSVCGRFTFATPPEVVAEFLALDEVPELSLRYNIAPTQLVACVRVSGATTSAATSSPTSRRPEGPAGRDDRLGRQLVQLRWGLIPSWADDPAIGNRLINARADTVAAKPSFRSAFKTRRCLVLADGFYEWKPVPGRKTKQPYYIRMRDGGPFAFAGLWERWTDPAGGAIESCTIITTEPNGVLRQIHDRMPVILPRACFDQWIDPSVRSAEVLQAMLVPHDASVMIAVPVSTAVNSPSRDGTECIRPLEGA